MQGGSMRSHGGTLYRSWVACGCTMIVTLTLGACDGERPTDPSVGGAVLGKATTDVTVTSTEPSSSARNVILDVRVLGTGFDQSAQATFLLDGLPDPRVRTNSTRYVKASEVVANLTIDADATPDLYSVQVALSSGRKGIGTEKFLVSTMVELAAPAGTSTASAVNAAGMMVGGRSGGCGYNALLPVVWTSPTAMTDLPLPPGQCRGSALGVNDAGQVLGYAPGAAVPTLLWTKGASGLWGVQSLGGAPGGLIVEGQAMNSAGVIVGAGYAAIGQPMRPYYWSPAEGWRPMPHVAGYTDCSASSINDVGQVVGLCSNGSGNVSMVWASVTTAPGALPLPAGAFSSYAKDINVDGTVAGTVRFIKGNTSNHYAARWVGSPGAYSVELIGGPLDLGGVNGINDRGQIVGSNTFDGTNHRAFLWDPASGMQDLGALNHISYGYGMNTPAPGQSLVIVGTSMVSAVTRAVRWVR